MVQSESLSPALEKSTQTTKSSIQDSSPPSKTPNPVLNNSSLLKRAESGDTCAQTKIGYNYTHSQGGLRQNYPKAIEWHLKAVNSSCNDAKCKQCKKSAYAGLGHVYSSRLYPRDHRQAFKWYLKAAENGLSQTYKSVAKYYAAGEFVKQDYEKAYYWITLGKGKNVKTSYEEFIAEIRSHLNEEQIKKIDDNNIKNSQKLAKEHRNKFADMMDQMTMGFNPNAPLAQKALSRLGFEIGINKFHYDLTGIKKLIDMGALNADPTKGSGLLFHAQGLDDLPLTKILIENNADINIVDNRGFSVLHRAIGYNHTDIALELIKAGANLGGTNDLAESPLIAATKKGNLEIVQALIKAGADVNFKEQSGYGKGQDALYHAFKKDYPVIASVLIDVGAIKGDLHKKFALGRNAKRNCGRETQLCPDKITRVSRTLSSCEFQACPIPKIPKIEKVIKGTFSEVNTELSKKAIYVLNNGNKEEKDRVIKEIKTEPQNYNPAVLRTLSRVLFSRIEDEDAAFWYIAADLRKRHDILICEDKTSRKKRASYYNIVHQFKPFSKLNADLMNSIYERVLVWDHSTPYNYDVRWVNIGGSLHTNQLTDVIPKNLCVPENKIEKVRAYSRTKYASVFKNYTKSFDYRADHQKRLKSFLLTKEEFKALLGKAEAGNASAQYTISTISLTPSHRELVNGDSKVFRKKWLMAASAQGHISAMSKLGASYISGYNVPMNERKSRFEEGKILLIEAGKKGSLSAFEGLAGYYMKNKYPIEAYAWLSLGEHILERKNPKLQMFGAKQKRMKLDATLPDNILKQAKIKAQEYIEKYTEK